MYGKSSALSSYGRVANSENDPLQQIVMLYDGAIKFLRLASANIESRDIPQKAEHVNRALDILNYLQSILDFERGGAVAQTLDNLYTLVSMKILRASANLDADGMRAAADLLMPVRDSWTVVAASAVDNAAATRPVAASDMQPRLGRMVHA
jgi:flagellar secretion chaperone FliS